MTDIKAFRKANNLTQEQLAVYLGTGKSFISLVEMDVVHYLNKSL